MKLPQKIRISDALTIHENCARADSLIGVFSTKSTFISFKEFFHVRLRFYFRFYSPHTDMDRFIGHNCRYRATVLWNTFFESVSWLPSNYTERWLIQNSKLFLVYVVSFPLLSNCHYKVREEGATNNNQIVCRIHLQRSVAATRYSIYLCDWMRKLNNENVITITLPCDNFRWNVFTKIGQWVWFGYFSRSFFLPLCMTYIYIHAWYEMH